jgi:hypothetical protein
MIATRAKAWLGPLLLALLLACVGWSASAFLASAFETTGADEVTYLGARGSQAQSRTWALTRDTGATPGATGTAEAPPFTATLIANGLLPDTRALDLFVSFPRNVRSVDAQLVDEASGCSWTPASGDNVLAGERIRFVRNAGQAACANSEAGDAASAVIEADSSRRLRLEINAPGLSAAALLGHDLAAPTQVRRTELIVADPSGGSTRFVVDAHALRPSGVAPRERVSLLATVWSGADSGRQTSTASSLKATLAALTVALLLGVVVLLFPRRTASARTSAVAFGLIIGPLFGLWALVMPPLQGADEPDHLLSGYQLAAPPADVAPLQAALADEAKRVHFERIKFQRTEGFNAADTLSPYPVAWARHVAAFDLPGRSALESGLFRFHRPRAENAPFTYLLQLRLLIGLWVAACGAACAWVLTRVNDGETPAGFHAVVALLALTPSVPHFSTHVSNYGFLIGSLLLVLCSASVRPRTERQGTLKFAALGVAFAFCALSGRAGITALALVPLASLWKPAVPGISSMRLWSTAFVAFAAPLVFAKPQSFAFLGRGFSVIAAWAPNVPANLLLVGLFGVACVVMALVDHELAKRASPASYTTAPEGRRPTQGERRIYAGAAGFFLLVLIVPWAFPVTPLRDNETVEALKGVAYVLEVVPRFFAGLGISNPEYFLTSSYWSGFGWLDTTFSRRLLRVLKCVPAALALLAIAGWWYRSDGKRPLAFLASSWLLAGIAVALLAFAISFERVNLHGRSLVLPYMVLLAGALLPLAMGRANRELNWVPTRLLAAAAIGVQFYALRFVLERHFPF